MDDIFAISHIKQLSIKQFDVDTLLYTNKFTSEKENKRQPQFLNILVGRANDRYTITHNTKWLTKISLCKDC